MKKILLILIVISASFFAKGQGTFPVPSTGGGLPVKQFWGSDSTLMGNKGVFWSKFGLVNGTFTDTTAANLTRIKQYPGAQIFATSDNSIWLRNNTASAWILQISNININNFLDSAVTNITINHDSTGIVICTNGVVPVCDTFLFAIDSIVSVVMIDDSTAIGCQEPRTTCVNGVCTTEQICDTIHVNVNNPVFLFDNGLRKIPALNEWQFGAADTSEFSSMLLHNTYFQNYFYWLEFRGKPNQHEVLGVRQSQWSQNSSSIMSWNHQGTNPYAAPPLVNPYNRVNLYLNYIAPMYKFGNLGGDSTGFMEDRTGYAFMTNARGGSYQYYVDNTSFKQTGIMFHFADTANRDAVTIFGQQVPAGYPLSPTLDSNLYDQRIAVFQTDKSTNFLGRVYLSNGRFEPDTAQITAANNLTLGNGNVFLVSGNTQINAIATSGWQAGSAPIHLVFSGTPTVKNNTAGGAGTATILLAGRTDFTAAAGDVLSLLFDGTNWYETNRSLVSTTGGGYFNPNQTSTALTSHNANFKDFAVSNLNSSEYTSGVQLSGNYTDLYFDSTLFNLQTHKGGIISAIVMRPDSILLAPSLGKLNIDTLQLGTSLDSVMVWNKTTGKVGYRNASSFGISGITADNGITASTATNVQLGSAAPGDATLLHTSFIATNGHQLNIYDDIGSNPVSISSIASAEALQVSSNGTYAIQALTDQSSTNTVVGALRVVRHSTGAVANGLGGSIDFQLETTTTSYTQSNQLSSKWVDATHATRTSQLDITGVNSAATGTIASFYGSGVVGIGISSSYTATRLNVVDNAVGAASIVDITSTSTAAASNLQKAVNINLSGANATASQTTFGLYVNNAHSGTSNDNYGIWVNTSNESGGAGIVINSTAAVALNAQSTSSNSALFTVYPSSTNTVVTNSEFRRFSTGTAADGIGESIDFKIQTASGVTTSVSNSIISKWTTAANATRTSTLTFQGVLSAATVDLLTLAGDGSVKLRPITATAASAITPAEGMLVFVSNTDATFTTIGIWCYQNGAWKAL